MKIHHVKWEWKRPILVHCRKHACPACAEELHVRKISSVVKSKSEEAKDYDFSSPGGDGYMIGNVKFIRTGFFCNACGRSYSVDEIYRIEKGTGK